VNERISTILNTKIVLNAYIPGWPDEFVKKVAQYVAQPSFCKNYYMTGTVDFSMHNPYICIYIVPFAYPPKKQCYYFVARKQCSLPWLLLPVLNAFVRLNLVFRQGEQTSLQNNRPICSPTKFL
jgi:hypothetical protein